MRSDWPSSSAISAGNSNFRAPFRIVISGKRLRDAADIIPREFNTRRQCGDYGQTSINTAALRIESQFEYQAAHFDNQRLTLDPRSNDNWIRNLRVVC